MEKEKSPGAERVKKWLKNPYNLGITLVLIIAFAIRLYFLLQVGDQPLWWDEAEYMATSKHWAFDVPYELNPQRPPLFQLLGALLLGAGFSELMLKFLLVVLPSVFLIYTIYWFGKETLGEKIGLLAAAASTFVWTYLFWSLRFQPDFWSMSFQMLSLVFFWRMFKGGEGEKKWAVYAGIFAALGFYFKISALIVPMIAFVFAVILDGWRIVKKKKYWIALGAYVLALVPLFLWQAAVFGNPLAFAPSYIEGTDKAGRDLGWQTFSYFYLFPQLLFFILMIEGLLLTLGRLGLTFDLLVKEKGRRLDAGLLSLVALIVTAVFYLFYIQGVIEDRWLFLIVPFVFYFSAIGIVWLSENFGGRKILAISISLLAIFAYMQFSYASAIIQNKQTSYQPIKDTGLWIKEHSAPEDLIFSISQTQTTAYSERNVSSYSAPLNESGFIQYLQEKKPKYMIVSIFEPHPSWIFQQGQYPDGSKAMIMPYFNSSLRISPQGQLTSADIKPVISRDGAKFTLVYPEKTFDGAFIYQVDWE